MELVVGPWASPQGDPVGTGSRGDSNIHLCASFFLGWLDSIDKNPLISCLKAESPLPAFQELRGRKVPEAPASETHALIETLSGGWHRCPRCAPRLPVRAPYSSTVFTEQAPETALHRQGLLAQTCYPSCSPACLSPTPTPPGAPATTTSWNSGKPLL